MTYRTVASVQLGISRQEWVDSATEILDYNPGNMTRYLVSILHVKAETTSLALRQMLGLGPGEGYIISLLNNTHRTYVCPADPDHVSWQYLAGKLGVNKADAVVLAELIAYRIGRTCVSSEEQRVLDGEVKGDSDASPPIAF